MATDVIVGPGARLRNVIIDKNVALPPGYVIGHDAEADAAMFDRSPGGIVTLGKGHRFDPGPRRAVTLGKGAAATAGVRR